VHLFLEANIKAFYYSVYIDPPLYSYHDNSAQVYQYNIFADHQGARIQTYTLIPALGLEIKIWKFIYWQLSAGSGIFYTKGTPVYSASIAASMSQSPYQPLYSGQFGFDWYIRTSFIFRINIK
jgi:hypothetical protein